MRFLSDVWWRMTISGGEPLLQPDFVGEVFRLCKQEGIHTALDTSGFAQPEAVEKVLEYVDLFFWILSIWIR